MKFVQRLVGRGRVRAARQDLARDPSPLRYVALARECAAAGMVRDARRVCEEGLEAFPGNAELRRMYQRARQIEAEERLLELRQELQEAPRPALWREICEILLDSGSLAEAESFAITWVAANREADAYVMRARILVARFFAGLSRAAGKAALDALDELHERFPRDVRPWELRLKLASSIGAWREARKSAAQILGLKPGDPVLEARFRAFDTLVDRAPDCEEALKTVERSGELADENRPNPEGSQVSDVRTLLRSLANGHDVEAAFYVRGGTALVQGSKGATAERAARAVRSVLKTSRSTARRLGLGAVQKIELCGDFGVLAVAPGEMDAGAVWCRGPVSQETDRALLGIAGLDAAMEGEAQ
jgi:tetratricopeptide (TPR) repeat protein